MSFFKKLFGRAEPSDNDGESPEFAAFLQASMEALRLQTAGHQAGWRLGESQRWDFDQDNGRLIFNFPIWLPPRPHRLSAALTAKQAIGCGRGRIRPSRNHCSEIRCKFVHTVCSMEFAG